MIEYEYSLVVEELKPYLDYCEQNKFEKIADTYQIRELYKNPNQILARITTEIIEDKQYTVLDFKDDNDSDAILKQSRETIPLVITNESREAIDSILNMLGYEVKKILKRNRIVYVNNCVKFELDHYMEPEESFVVAIEGEKEEVDKIYQEIVGFDNKTSVN